jgi:hypothetical protein
MYLSISDDKEATVRLIAAIQCAIRKAYIRGKK